MSSHWIAATSFGQVTVWAESEAQARSRAKWKAAHAALIFRNRAEEMSAVRECEVFAVRKIEEVKKA